MIEIMREKIIKNYLTDTISTFLNYKKMES